ncbi:MAG TPA: hypothetical protein DDZ89_18810 [Clostridiales bacterium]|nr:hypothetical protein [Clostridiales bacterium]
MGIPVESPSRTIIDRALSDIFESIALVEDTLDSILNAQGVKVQEEDLEKIEITDNNIEMNDSIKALSKTVFRVKALLRFQHENVIELTKLLA